MKWVKVIKLGCPCNMCEPHLGKIFNFNILREVVYDEKKIHRVINHDKGIDVLVEEFTSVNVLNA